MKLYLLATAVHALQLPNVLKRGKAAPALEKMRFLTNEETRTVAQDFGTPTYVYDADTLEEINRHETQEVFHGAGGIGSRNDHFFVVGGLPNDIEENYIYEYDKNFRFIKRHVVTSGHTHLGIQTATLAHNRWWFGCYGDPKILLVTDIDFEMQGRYPLDCSLGIERLSRNRLLVGSGQCNAEGCTGHVRSAVPHPQLGFQESPSR